MNQRPWQDEWPHERVPSDDWRQVYDAMEVPEP